MDELERLAAAATRLARLIREGAETDIARLAEVLQAQAELSVRLQQVAEWTRRRSDELQQLEARLRAAAN